MILEQKLMRSLMRAAGTARRRTEPSDTHSSHGRGFGHILDLLGKEGISQQHIADALGIRPQSVSEAVTALENRGYVCRIPSETDKRKMLICITDEGLTHREELKVRRKAHAQQFFSSLTQEEKTQLLYLLEKLGSQHTDKENV